MLDSSSTRPNATTWRAIAVALVVFVVLDAAVFRSGLYALLAKPDSNAGWMVRRTLLTDDPVVKRDGAVVLVLGDSRMGEAADETRLAKLLAAHRVTAVSGAVPGSTPRVWPTLFAHVPAPSGGYDLVVVGLAAYADDGESEDFARRSLDLAFLGPWLGPQLARELAADLADPADSGKVRDVWLATFVKSFAWRRDLQDLAADPWTRYREIRRRLGQLRWGDPYPGVDRTANVAELQPHAGGVDNRAYRRRWLGQLVRDVRATGAKVLFVRMPRPVAVPGGSERQTQRVIDELERSEGVRVVAEDVFAELDAPDFFFDALHLNRRGRARFTELLARELEPLCAARARRTK